MKPAAEMEPTVITQDLNLTTAPNSQPIPNQLREQPDFAMPTAILAEIDELITHYPKKRSASLMLLHAVQDHFGFISRQAVEWIAAKLELQPINVYELVTFYPMFHHNRVGKYHLRVCRTLSCALGGSYKLHDHLCNRLGLNPNGHRPQTTKDGKFTVEFVECLASCGTAPVMMCNETFYEGVSEKKAQEIVASCR
jgi:NADH-quinone oxidoreductase subunit E